MRDLLDGYDATDRPGAAVMVLRGGRPAHTAVVGLARLDDPTPVEPRTNFRLASITKQFTARSVALLVDDGVLALDVPARELLPELPAWAAGIRIGHLLAHTSGLPPYEALVPEDRTRPLTDVDVLHLVAAAAGPGFPAGSRFAYDNGGYALLAVIAERVSGRRFGDLLRERIFAPLGMRGTVAHEEGRTTVLHRALGYREVDGRWVLADQGVTTAVLGDGGVYSSLEDLARWDAALSGDGSPPDPRLLEPYAAPVDTRTRYGFGWFVDRFEGRLRHRHEGWTTGFQNEIQRFPDEGLTVIVLTNRAEPPARALAEAIARRW